MFHLRQETHKHKHPKWTLGKQVRLCKSEHITLYTPSWDSEDAPVCHPLTFVLLTELREQSIMSFQEYNSENIPICNAHPD